MPSLSKKRKLLVKEQFIHKIFDEVETQNMSIYIKELEQWMLDINFYEQTRHGRTRLFRLASNIVQWPNTQQPRGNFVVVAALCRSSSHHLENLIVEKHHDFELVDIAEFRVSIWDLLLLANNHKAIQILMDHLTPHINLNTTSWHSFMSLIRACSIHCPSLETIEQLGVFRALRTKPQKCMLTHCILRGFFDLLHQWQKPLNVWEDMVLLFLQEGFLSDYPAFEISTEITKHVSVSFLKYIAESQIFPNIPCPLIDHKVPERFSNWNDQSHTSLFRNIKWIRSWRMGYFTNTHVAAAEPIRASFDPSEGQMRPFYLHEAASTRFFQQVRNDGLLLDNNAHCDILLKFPLFSDLAVCLVKWFDIDINFYRCGGYFGHPSANWLVLHIRAVYGVLMNMLKRSSIEVRRTWLLDTQKMMIEHGAKLPVFKAPICKMSRKIKVTRRILRGIQRFCHKLVHCPPANIDNCWKYIAGVKVNKWKQVFDHDFIFESFYRDNLTAEERVALVTRQPPFFCPVQKKN